MQSNPPRKSLYPAIATWFPIFVCAALQFGIGQTTWKLDTVIAAGKNPVGIALTPDDAKILVTNNTAPGSVTLLSATTFARMDSIPSVGDYPNEIQITPDGSTALVVGMNPNGVAFLDLSTNAVTGKFAAPCVGTTLYGLAITPDGGNAVMPDLAANCVDEGLRTFDATGASSATNFITVNGVGSSIALTPDGKTAFIATLSPTNTAHQVDLTTGTVGGMNIAGPIYCLTVNHAGTEMLVAKDSILRVSLPGDSVLGSIPFSVKTGSFRTLAISPDDRFAFAVGDFSMALISLEGDSVVKTFSAAGVEVALSSDGKKVYVTDSYNGQVRVYGQVTGAGIDSGRRRNKNEIAIRTDFTGHGAILHLTAPFLLQNAVATLYDPQGRIHAQVNSVNGKNPTLAVKALSHGPYFLEISQGNRLLSTVRWLYR